MAQEQGTETNKKGMNNKENSSTTDSISDNKSTGESSWRATDGGESEMKEPTENKTGAAGQSPAQQPDEPVCTPNKADDEDFKK